MGIEDDTQILIPEYITVNLGLLQILVNRNSLLHGRFPDSSKVAELPS
jgi:hypothetical protein